MSIILKENEWAKTAIEERELGKKPSETLQRVARYYLDEGYSTKQVRQQMDIFLLRCDPSVSLPKWSDTLDYAVSKASKYEAVNIDSIDITDKEMAHIDSIKGMQVKRLAFTLLCLAKYWTRINPSGDYWVNNKDTEIMRLANIKTSIKRQSEMYGKLKELGMIQFSKKVDNTNVHVCFAEDGEVVLRISDFRNLGYQYLMFHGEPYFKCENCGIVTKIKGGKNKRKQKYCPSCAVKIHTQQKVDFVMRIKYKGMEDVDTNSDVYTVYMHECPDNHKRYVGMTSSSLSVRWKNGAGYVNNAPFYSDILKYGWENIKHYKIATTQDEELAKLIELGYVHKYNTDSSEAGYNRLLKRYIEVDENIILSYTPIEVDVNGFDVDGNHISP